MKRLFFGAIIVIYMLLFSVSAFADTTIYNLDEIGISVDMPSEYAVFTRQIDDNVVSYLESGNMYLMAIDNNLQFEIYINMEPTNNSITNLNDLSRLELSIFHKLIKHDLAQSGYTSSKPTFYENSGIKFMKCDFQYSGKDEMLSYITIHNSKTISIILRLISGEFTDEQRSIMGEIAKSIKFTSSDDTDVSSTHIPIDYVIIFFLIVIIILIIGIKLFLKYRKRDLNK